MIVFLPKNFNKASDVIRLAFRASPLCSVLQIIISFVYGATPTVLIALATANFVDTAITVLNGEGQFRDIYVPLFLLILILGLTISIVTIIQLIKSRITLDLQRKLDPVIVDKHASLDYVHIENAESWELISRASRDPTKSIMDGFEGYTMMFYIVSSIASVFILVVTNVWWVAFVIIAFSIPMFFLSVRMGQRKYQSMRDAEKFNRRAEYLDEVLTGRDAAEERTLFGYGDLIGERWEEQYEAGRKLKLKVFAREFFITKGSGLFIAVASLIVSFALITPTINGDISVGLFMGIVVAVFNMVGHLGWRMSDSLERISAVSGYMKDLAAFFKLSETIGASEKPDDEPLFVESLEFRNVRFKYPSGERYIFDGLSFKLESGRHYAFVGVNGAGKTTIIKLLTGLYSGYEGEIMVNSKELREYPAGALKAMFSVVHQDFARYFITLKDNIALGDVASEYADYHLSEAAKHAGLDETVEELKNGIHTPLGKIKSDGQDISGGQWQRVAIARSLISRSSVKILDEPTAALDPIIESRIYKEFEKLMKGKTTVFISHRLGSTKLADEILVVDDGRIVERGSHNDLMDEAGLYASMFESQKRWYV